jgi:hypothetical protein
MDRTRQATDANIIRPMCFACWITKATDIHSEYVIVIAFPRQQWLRERISFLSYTYIAFPIELNLFVTSLLPIFAITRQHPLLLLLLTC